MILLVLSTSLIFGLIVTGFLYQWIGGRRDRVRFTSDGRWVDIGNGRRLYLIEKGTGGRTVVFESGIAATNLNWFRIQQAVSSFTATASYDRGGLGWSSPCRSARTPANIAAELHTMLQRAGIKPPYVLVGHSFGGLVMRRFALSHPDEVLSLILVDPMRCEEWPPVNPSQQAAVDRGDRLAGIAIPVARLGVARLATTSLLCRSGRMSRWLAGAGGGGAQHVLGRVREEIGKMPREIWPIVAAHWSRPDFYAGMRQHVKAVPDTVREMRNAPPIRDIPILVLTPDKSKPLSDECLRRIGENVRQVIVPQSGHWIHLDQPDRVIDWVRTVVEEACSQPLALTT
ncbi:MAG: alpha/beta fold hydrolase [Terracidiphilus sp.]